MAMDNVRIPVRLIHILQSCSAEKCETFRVVVITVENASVKKTFFKVRINKKTLPAMNKTEKNRTMDLPVIVRDPKVVIYLMQIIDMVIPHTVIFGKNDLYIVPPDLQFTRQSVDNIGKSANLGHRGTFRSNHYNMHGLQRLYTPGIYP
jgi:hypothetical protein